MQRSWPRKGSFQGYFAVEFRGLQRSFHLHNQRSDRASSLTPTLTLLSTISQPQYRLHLLPYLPPNQAPSFQAAYLARQCETARSPICSPEQQRVAPVRPRPRPASAPAQVRLMGARSGARPRPRTLVPLPRAPVPRPRKGPLRDETSNKCSLPRIRAARKST